MQAARRSEPPAPDLAALRRQYESLPHLSVRWRTQIGRDFLDVLDHAVNVYRPRVVAEALGLSVQGVDYMLTRQRLTRPVAWPTPDDLRALQAAWRVVQAVMDSGRVVRRQSPEFVPVHTALLDLLPRFQLSEIALAMGLRLRHLKRFIEPPIPSPAQVARAVHTAVTPPRPDWRER